MDEINNHDLVHDYNVNQIYEQYYETDEITIADINLTRGNYIVTLISKEGFADQQVIIVE